MNQNLVRTYAALLGVTILALIVIQQLDIAYPLNVRTSANVSELSVVGEGKVEAVPDTASINVGISVSNVATVQEAQQKINDINNKIVAAMQGLGLSKNDIKTSNYSIYPYYGSEPQPKVSGYNGNVSVAIKTKHVDKVPDIITQATAAGANEVQGVSFSIDNPDSFREQAREEAIKNAKEQGKKLAKQLGIRLGRVTNIVEATSGDYVPYQKYALAETMSAGGGGPQIEPGSQTITSVVTLYFDKK